MSIGTLGRSAETGNKLVLFCPYCGTKLDEGARFCKGCGEVVGGGTHDAPKTVPSASTAHGKPFFGNPTERKTVYEGYLHKCPSCGEVVKAFVTSCPSCGHELRGAKVSSAIREFTLKLEMVKTESQKANLIRTFPIPNTKEDIFEFMILASTNIVGESQQAVFHAWQSKFEQSYQKAKLVFHNESDFAKVQDIYEGTHREIQKAKRGLSAKATRESLLKSAPDLPNILIATVWIISLFVLIALSFIRDGTDQVIFAFDLLAGAIAMPFVIKCDSSAPKLIVFFGLSITIVVLAVIEKFVPNAEASVLLVFDIIATAVIVSRGVLKKRNQTDKGE